LKEGVSVTALRTEEVASDEMIPWIVQVMDPCAGTLKDSGNDPELLDIPLVQLYDCKLSVVSGSSLSFVAVDAIDALFDTTTVYVTDVAVPTGYEEIDAVLLTETFAPEALAEMVALAVQDPGPAHALPVEGVTLAVFVMSPVAEALIWP
jgi:hypothetical protein